MTRPVRRIHQLIPADVRELLRSNPALRAVLLTDFLVYLAELMAAVILPWWITSRGGASAIATFSVMLPVATFFAAPLVSPFGDRLCKARQITWGLGCLGLVAATQAALALDGRFSIAALMALAFVQVLARSFVDPAREAVLTEQVAPEQLPIAIRMRKTTLALCGILGPLLAGAAIGAVGVGGALCFQGGLLGVAMLTAWRIPRTQAANTPARGWAPWWNDLRAGLGAKWRMPMERGWTLVNFAVWIFQGPAVGLLIPIKVQSLALAGHWLGLAMGALSLGVLLGSLFGSAMLVRRFGRYRVRVGLGFLEGIALAVVGWSDSPTLLLIGLAAAGFCNASMSLVGATHRALAIPRAYRVRLSAASAMTTQIAGSIGPALVGVALAHFSVNAVYAAWGLCMATCVLGFLAVPRLKEFLALEHHDIADWYGRQYPALFKSTPGTR